VDYDKLLKEIERAGEFEDRAHARDAAGAVLSVLGEHLAGGAPRKLAAQLPPELADALPFEGDGRSFGVEQFDLRVAEREGRKCPPERAHAHAVAVLSTVLSAVPEAEARNVAAQLSREYDDLLPASVIFSLGERTVRDGEQAAASGETSEIPA
jgi:uncharacterized protein (DUF2267 family)